jgi:tetratricopeptide (TPR) repeat protein
MVPNAMDYQLFISYARSDNRLGHVTELVNSIKQRYEEFAGTALRVYFDIEEIAGMDDWQHRILGALRKSHLLLVCISPAYLKSKPCEWEFNEYLKHEAGRFTGCEGIAPIYLVEVPGWEKSALELGPWLTELRRRNHFDFRPWIGEGEHTLRLQAVRVQIEKLRDQVAARIRRGEQAAQSTGNVEPYNPRFIGRTRELSQLREQLALQRVGAMVAIHGLGGMGKTALAIAYAYAFAHEYAGGRWQVSCDGLTDLPSVLLKLQGVRDLAFEFTESERKNSNSQFERLLRELKQRADASEPSRCLIILDNVNRAELLSYNQRKLLPQNDWLHVIATTRLGDPEISNLMGNLTFVPVDEISASDAVDLIERYQPDGAFRNADERLAAGEIVRLLDRFTLALETAALFLGQNRNVTCRGFLSRLRKQGLRGLDAAAGGASATLHGEQRLSATLQPTLERLSAEEREVLAYAALLPADTIPVLWLRALAAEGCPALGADAEIGDTGPWDRVVVRLSSLRLLQPTGTAGSDEIARLTRIHRLVQELVRRSWTDEERRRYEESFESFIATGLQTLHSRTQWSSIAWELDVVAGLAEKWADEHHPQATKLLRYGASGLRAVAHWRRAEQLLRRALDIDEAAQGADPADVISDLNDLGLLLTDIAQFADAEPLVRRALEIARSFYGAGHLKIVAPLNNLALLLKATDRPAEAEPLLRQALEVIEASDGPNAPEAATVLTNLAALLRGIGRAEDAEVSLRRALAIFETTRGPDHPDFGTCLATFGALLRDTDRLAEAEPLLVRALAIDRASYGYNHPKVAADLTAYALLLEETGRSADAELLMRGALDIDVASYGREHPEVTTDLGNLARLLMADRRYSEAEPFLRLGLANTRAAAGLARPALISWLCELAIALSFDGTGRIPQAEALAREALELVLVERRESGNWHERHQTVFTLYEHLLLVAGASPEAAHDRLRELFDSYGLQWQGGHGDGAPRLH